MDNTKINNYLEKSSHNCWGKFQKDELTEWLKVEIERLDMTQHPVVLRVNPKMMHFIICILAFQAELPKEFY